PRPPSGRALGAFRGRGRVHRPYRQGPRRRRRMAAARAPAARGGRSPRRGPARGVNLLACYGGSFDPVHLGHMAVALAVRDALGAEVALVPAADPPHKDATHVAAEARARMLELAIGGEPGLRVDRREL